MTDNRTNEPTPEQVEAAARVIWEMDSTTLGAEPPESLEAWEFETKGYLELARAVLVAAQGAAPQAEIHERIQAWELLVEHPVWRSCFGEGRPLIDSMMERIDKLAELEMTVNELAPAPVLPSSGESPVKPFKTWFACWWKNEPNAIAESNAQSAFYAGWDARGLPSSGVDEAALAEVMGSHRISHLGQCECGHVLETYGHHNHEPEEIMEHLAREVAAWLKDGAR